MSCSGHGIDHIKPLKEGGAEEPANMQWQSVEPPIQRLTTSSRITS
jgi:hypothetical protein